MDNMQAGVNSLSIVGRLSTLQSVHYQRFHCIDEGWLSIWGILFHTNCLYRYRSTF